MKFVIIAGLIVLAFFAIKFFIKQKRYVVGTVNVITGAPKTCKTALTISLAIKEYKRRLFAYYFKHYVCLWNIRKYIEKPCLYSNIPLANVNYVPLTNELLLRQTRFAYKSVVIFDEFYLIADSMTFKDQSINENLSLLMKLIGHETKGGCIFLNTQNRSDLHFAVKRCCLSYLYIFKKVSLPGVVVLSCRELLNSEEIDIVNTIEDDPQEDLSFRRFIMFKKVFKNYDPYAYSILTDDLECENKELYQDFDTASLKTKTILSLKRGKNYGKQE